MSTPLFREVGLPAKNINNLAYAGNLLNIVPIVGQDRAPTSNNYRFPVNTFWNNTDDLAVSPDAKGDLWYMSKKSQYQATWVKLSGGGTGPLLQFTPSSGSVVFPNATTGNVNMTAGAGITITGTSETLTFALSGGGSAVDSFAVQAVTAPGVTPVEPTALGLVTISGAAVANHSVPLETRSRALNAFNLEVQYATSAASTDATKSGVAHFNSTQFSVDANGFVALAGGGIAIDTVAVQAITAPGVTPVTADATGLITVNGAAVAAHSVPIESRSRALNAYNIEVQYSSAVAATDATKSGLAHFNNTQFTVDANGFVALAGGGLAIDSINVDANTAPGTDPVVPSATGEITVTGAQVAPGVVGANVIRSNSLAANSYTMEIQQTSAVAAKDTTKNGVSHFNSAQFTNDEGFISIIASGDVSSVNVQRVTATGAFTYTPTSGMTYVIVELCAGGGGSGGVAATTGNVAISGAGTGGGYAKFLLTAAQVGASLTGSVGAGGTAGSAGNNAGGNGGNTTLATAAAWTCTGGTGGAGGAAGANATVNAAGGGAVTTGTGTVILAITGGQSGNGAAAAATVAMSGCGGSSGLGVGGPNAFEAVTSNGSSGHPGSGYGAGAGGSISYGTVGALAGTAGTQGIAIFTEFIG